MKFYTNVAVALLFALTSVLSVSAQCNPNPLFANEEHGVYPQGSVGLDCSGLGADLTVVGVSDTAVEIPVNGQTSQIYFDALRLDSVVGLPAGLIIESDVLGSASAASPYGEWVYSGAIPSFTPSLGCLRLSGNASAIAAASTGGPNNDGVYPLTFYLNYRIAYSDPDLSFIFPNGSWLSEAATGSPTSGVELLLDINGSSCGAAFFISTEVTASTDTTQGCDGSVTTQVFGGQPPYSYSYSNGGNTQSVYGLCPGLYTVDVTDANGDSGSGQFAVGVASNTYSNVNPAVLPSTTDSLFFSSGYCDLDYNLPVDSFSVVSAFAQGNDTLAVEWVIYQQGSPFSVLSFYPNGNPDPTVFSLILFCENGRSETGVFQLYEYVESPLLVGVADGLDALWFTLRPNPTTGEIWVEIGDVQLGRLEVYDVTGNLVLQDAIGINSANRFELNALPDGVYFMRILSQQGVGAKRIVKSAW